MKQVISQILILCILVQTNLIAYGQVRTDGTTQTGVRKAANGVDVIDIANPNSKGLSHNKYIDFNVEKRGLILNNSKTLGRSELGGIITGNENLGSNARIILNEVTSTNRSNLQGHIEVFGNQADVIVANPNGISCNGCGFINTPSATLTTGKPIVEGGELKRFDVNDGQVTIGELGLDASQSDYFDIISRAVQINGTLHAKGEARVISGRNTVDYKTKEVSAKADDGSLKPEFGIDSSALGGMYAGAITLIGTEAGVGVKTPENAVAELGNFHITADGKVIVNNALAKKDLKIEADQVEIIKSAYGKEKVEIKARETKIQENALLASSEFINIEGTQLELSADANIISNLNETGELNSVGRIAANIDELNIKGDAVIYGKSELNLGTLVIDTDKKLTLDESKINFTTNQTLETGEIDAHTSLEINSTADFTNKIKIQGDELIFRANNFDNQAQLISFGNLYTFIDQDLINSGRVEAADSLFAEAGSDIRNNTGGLILAKNLVSLRANNEIYNGKYSDIISADGDIYLGGLDNIKAALVTNDAGNIESINGDIYIKANSFKNLSQGYQKQTYRVYTDKLIGGHVDRATTYFYDAYDSNGDRVYVTFFGNTSPLTSQEINYLGSSFPGTTPGIRLGGPDVTWVDSGRRGSRELWPHQEAKYETVDDQRQINAGNFEQGKILAQGDIHIEADNIENNLSLIAANNDVNISGGSFNNLSGVYRRTTTIETYMENRTSGHDSYWYWAPDQVSHRDRFAFSTIEAGRSINLSVSGIVNNGNRNEAMTNPLDVAPTFADIASQNTSINLGAISGRENLFKEIPDINSPYLYETDSQFINLNDFFSSDYFLDQVFNNSGGAGEPEEILRRRYGDAYVEERLVRDQLFTITGRRVLDDYSDSYSQMQALYDNALENMNELNLSFGVSLTQEQMDRLTKDMIWLETQKVNGVEVLVPRVYLSKFTLENIGSRGSQIVASETNLFSGNLFNTGSIEGRKKLHIETGNLFNMGGKISGGDVSLKAVNIINQRLTESGSINKDVEFEYTDPFTGKVVKVKATEQNQDYTIAGNDSIIKATGNLDIVTSGVVQNIGGNISAGDDLSIKAGGGIVSTSITESMDYKRKGQDEENISSLTHLKGGISAGGDLSLEGKKITLVGTDLKAGENIDIKADEGVDIVSVQDEENYYFYRKDKGGLFKSSTKTTIMKNSVTTNKSEIVAGGDINITSKTKDVLVKAAIFKADGEVNIEAVEGDIKLVSAIDSMFEQTKVEKKNALAFKNTDKGEKSTTQQGVEIYASDTNLKAKSIQIDIKDTIDELSQKEGFEYLEKLKDDPRVDWNLVQDEFEQWDETQTGLSQAASLLVAIAVSVAIGPGGAGVFAAMGNAALTSLATQAATSMIANGGDLGAVFKELGSSDYLKGLAVATVTAGAGGNFVGDSLIRAGADSLVYGRSFEDSLESNIKAGGLNYIGGAIGNFGGEGLGADIAGAGGRAVIRAGAESLIYQRSFGDALEENAKSEAVVLGGRLAANEIGNWYKDAKDQEGISTEEYIAHKVAHAALGCAMGAASGGSCAGGAIGGAVSEIVAEKIANDIIATKLSFESLEERDNFIRDKQHLVTKLGGGAGVLAAAILGEDVDSAYLAGENAAANNMAPMLVLALLTLPVSYMLTSTPVTEEEARGSSQKIFDGMSEGDYSKAGEGAGELATDIAVQAGIGVALGIAGKYISSGLGKIFSKYGDDVDDFFRGAKYSEKVKNQVDLGDFHSFPESVKGFQGSGTVEKIIGGDGIEREILKIPGGYRGREGVFEFIKEPNGEISHHFFNSSGASK